MQLADKHEGTTTTDFASLRVPDFSTTIAGPRCARMLVDMGAEVVKIETDGGETMRTRPPVRNGAIAGQTNRDARRHTSELLEETGLSDGAAHAN
jgi:CoA:oxalate CoA-transferase